MLPSSSSRVEKSSDSCTQKLCVKTCLKLVLTVFCKIFRMRNNLAKYLQHGLLNPHGHDTVTFSSQKSLMKNSIPQIQVTEFMSYSSNFIGGSSRSILQIRKLQETRINEEEQNSK